MSFTMPNTITNGATRDARPLQANFAAITSALQNDFVRADGTIAMTAALQLSGDPVNPTEAASKAYVDLSLPPGVIVDFGGDTAPTGWALGIGQLMNKSDYPVLWSLFANKFGVSTETQFYFPDLQSVFIVGKGGAAWSDVIGETGGSKDAVAVEHVHSIAHNHSSVSDSDAFWKNTGIDGETFGFESDGSSPPLSAIGTGDVDIDLPNFVGNTSSQTPTSTGTDKNLPPYIVLNKIIRLG